MQIIEVREAQRESVCTLAVTENDSPFGQVTFGWDGRRATILDLTVSPEHRGRGVGSGLIDAVFQRFEAAEILAETDDGAVGFFRKYGFSVAQTSPGRYLCTCPAAVWHYNALVDEGDDPVRDPLPLQEYMDGWDGAAFLGKMQLTGEKSALEIGVGTGRIARRAAELCSELWGVDLSPKALARARENLSEFGNVTLLCGDFLTLSIPRRFDVIYSSLTFMHIEDKMGALKKIAGLLNENGRLVLSIDRNPDETIDMGTRRIRIFPDSPEATHALLTNAGFAVLERLDLAQGTVFVAEISHSPKG